MLKALELLKNALKDEPDDIFEGMDDDEAKQYVLEAIKVLEDFAERFDTLQKYVKELECDCVSLQKDYSNKCKELEELYNKNCNNCEFKYIDGEDENSVWEKWENCSNCQRYYEDKFKIEEVK